MPCPAVLAAAAEGGTRLAHDPASASEAAMASTAVWSGAVEAVGAAGGSARDPTAATEAADEAAGAAGGPKDATGMELAAALNGEVALGLPAACAAFTGPWSCRAEGMSWLPWGVAMLDGGVMAGSHKSGVIMTPLPWASREGPVDMWPSPWFWLDPPCNLSPKLAAGVLKLMPSA